MLYVFDEFGEFMSEFDTITSVEEYVDTSRHLVKTNIDSRRTVNSYYISSVPTLWKGFKPSEVYIFNSRGVLIQITGSYESLYTRVTNREDKKVIKEFFFNEKVEYLELKEYRYYKSIPEHVPDLFKRYSLLDEDGNITNYYRDLNSICTATGLSRQSVYYQTTKKDGFIRRNC